MSPTCPECGAIHPEGRTCTDDFHQLLFWESEDMEVRGVVHHLMVLCYHLQHPSLYSPETLAGSRQMLADFVEGGVTSGEMRRRNKVKLSSTNRNFKITGTLEHHGNYSQPVPWTMRAVDVVAGGAEHYVENVRAWAKSMQAALKASEAGTVTEHPAKKDKKSR